VRHNQVVFDINGGEMLVLGAVAIFVLGPERLPGYAAQAARMIRQLRELADSAKDQVREQMGPEFDDVDWSALDPRQYDPRRIVREALFDDEPAAEKPVTRPDGPRAAYRPEAGGSASADSTTPGQSGQSGQPVRPAGAYDDEAT
jgi:sec-independent protein translocase protein TatB